MLGPGASGTETTDVTATGSAVEAPLLDSCVTGAEDSVAGTMSTLASIVSTTVLCKGTAELGLGSGADGAEVSGAGVRSNGAADVSSMGSGNAMS